MDIVKKLVEAISRNVELDANDTLFLTKQLEKIEAQAYDTVFPELQYSTLLPVEVSNDPWAETVTYRQYTPAGRAKLIANYATDIPNITKFVKEFTRKVYKVAAAYMYDQDEIEKAIHSGLNLSAEYVAAARYAIEQEIDNIALLGDSDARIEGFFSMTGAQTYTVPADGTGVTKTWSTKTAALMIRDVVGCIDLVRSGTGNAEMANAVALPPASYALLASAIVSGTSTNALMYLKSMYPDVTFFSANKLAGILGGGNGERMIAYSRNPRKVKFTITQPFTSSPPQANDFTYKVPCKSKITGTVSPYPMSMAYGDGI